MADIVQVIMQADEHLLYCISVAIIESSVRGNAGSYLIEILVSRVLLHNLIDEERALRSVANEGHVALQHIPQLREFIKMMRPEELASLRESRVAILIKELRDARCLGVGSHRAELIYLKWLPMPAYSCLRENNLAMVILLNKNVAKQEQRGEYYQTHHRADNIEGAFVETPEPC